MDEKQPKKSTEQAQGIDAGILFQMIGKRDLHIESLQAQLLASQKEIERLNQKLAELKDKKKGS